MSAEQQVLFSLEKQQQQGRQSPWSRGVWFVRQTHPTALSVVVGMFVTVLFSVAADSITWL